MSRPGSPWERSAFHHSNEPNLDRHKAFQSRRARPRVKSRVETGKNDKETVEQLDVEYQSAVSRNDHVTMSRILADGFALISSTGKVYSKADLLDEARSGRVVYERQDDSERTVRAWGDTAVVTALLWAKGKEDGKSFEYRVWFSDTYAKIGGRWQYVLGHASARMPAPAL
jgi:ketosteroid isomerase-like protein